jgi:hypothetical protein
MKSGRLGRRIAAVVGGAAIVTMVGLTASCAREEEPAPATEPATEAPATEAPATEAPATESPPAEPTEKAPRIDPGQPNPFSPTVIAPPAPTGVPGDN